MERNISDVIVVGSGASGVHAAAVIAEAGCAVTMLDAGYRDETYAKLIPDKTFFNIRRKDGSSTATFWAIGLKVSTFRPLEPHRTSLHRVSTFSGMPRR